MLEKMESREKWIVFGGGGLAVLLLLYVFVWEPWQQELTQLRQRVPNKQETLLWMRDQVANLKPQLDRATNGGGGSAPLLTVVEQSAGSANVREFIRRMAPGETPGQVRVWLTDASFDSWMQWLEVLRAQGVEVISASVSGDKDGSKVTIRATLGRGA